MPRSPRSVRGWLDGVKHSLVLALALVMPFACKSSRDRPPVNPPPNVLADRVEVTPPSLTLEIGQTGSLSAQVFDADGNTLTRAVTWSSSNPETATVTDVGSVTGVAEGKTTVTASVNGKSAGAEITVVPANMNPVATVEVSPATGDLVVGETLQLSATLKDADGSVLANRTVSWTSSAEGVATVSGTGLVSAVGPGSAEITATAEGVSGSASVNVTEPQIEDADVELDVATRFQTMTGWEGTAQMGQWECDPTAFANYRDTVIDRSVNELGLNRVRLEILSGAEERTDWFGDFINGNSSFAEWRNHWYAPVNDNKDPNTIDPAGFQFSNIDHTIDNVVTPMRQALAARGEELYVNLCYVDFQPSAFSHKDNPDEYAELILATFMHIESTYGWVPDGVEIILEPDVANWTSAQTGAAFLAVAQRLEAAGYTPAFSLPSNTSMWGAINAFDEITANQTALSYVTELTYHRYEGVGFDAAMAVGDRVQNLGIKSAMLEHIGSGIDDLWQDLTVARNSAWSQYTISFCNPADTGAKYYTVDQSNPNNPTVRLEDLSRYFPQIFRHVRRGAVRHKANTQDATLEPLAFLNSNGKWTIVVRTTGARTFTVGRLPPGTYGTYYTTDSEFAVETADVTIEPGRAVELSIPAAGIITLYQK